jgi:hypothetical protein
MDINKAITFATDDDRWISKLLIGTALIFFSFLIIPMFFFYGYMIQIVRNVMAGETYPLPEWANWGKLFKDGIALFVAGLVYTAPIWLLICCSFAFFIPGANTGGDVGDILLGIGIFALVVMTCLIFLFVIAYALIGPAIMIQYAREDKLSACFQVGTVLGITRDHIGDILIALILIFALSFVVSLPAMVPFIGWIVTFVGSIYLGFVTGHLYGQIGAKVGGTLKEKSFDPAG